MFPVQKVYIFCKIWVYAVVFLNRKRSIKKNANKQLKPLKDKEESLLLKNQKEVFDGINNENLVK